MFMGHDDDTVFLANLVIAAKIAHLARQEHWLWLTLVSLARQEA